MGLNASSKAKLRNMFFLVGRLCWHEGEERRLGGALLHHMTQDPLLISIANGTVYVSIYV